MNFKPIFFLVCLAFYTEAQDVAIRIPIFKSYGADNEPQFGGSPATDSAVNLIVNLTVSSTGKGTPPIGTYQLTLDSLTHNVWIVSKDCKSRFCHHKPKTLPSKQGKLVVIDNKQVTGYNDTYNVELGKVPIKDVPIVAATSVSQIMGKRLTMDSDGIIGLTNNIIPSVQGIISLQTSGNKPGLYIGIPSGLTVENVTNTKPNYINFEKDNSWEVKINYISNDMGAWQTWCNQGCSANIDSTFIGISGPAEDINSINTFIGTDDQGNIDCYKVKQLQPIIFHMGYHEYKIDPKNYILKSGNKFSYKCSSAFMVNSNGDDWTLGMPLFDQYLTVIDYNNFRIDFMALRSNVLPITNFS